jgi:hypothetical protein
MKSIGKGGGIVAFWALHLPAIQIYMSIPNQHFRFVILLMREGLIREVILSELARQVCIEISHEQSPEQYFLRSSLAAMKMDGEGSIASGMSMSMSGSIKSMKSMMSKVSIKGSKNDAKTQLYNSLLDKFDHSIIEVQARLRSF